MLRSLHTRSRRPQAGFSLIELMISMGILLVVSSAVTGALLQMTASQGTIWNRTQMHGGVRSATELLQQEVGQAGRVALPANVTLTAATVADPMNAQTVGVLSAAGMFTGEQLTIDSGANQETVTLTAVDTVNDTITAIFELAHNNGASVMVLGGFPSGIVPPVASGFANGSTGTLLKMYGDINGDGNMVYVEYFCDTVNGNLYRNVMPFDAAPPKPAVTVGDILLSNILSNPNGTPCFTYNPNPQPVVILNAVANTYVLDVAITLTVQTQTRDQYTKQFQLETKALLNVSPRNVFNVWQLASAGIANRVQPMPATVAALLP
jgi:prepilin-type N-terminal cleavage/methylation domain-containing protein